MAAPRGSAARTLEWTANNVGTGPRRISKWTHEAGFTGFVQWCGVFLGSALKAQGIEPPSGYPSAVEWSNYGKKVNSLAEARPGDILVYGTHHVAMYLGNGRQRQGNDANGTVGDSGVGASLGLGPITAIRRPPYKGGPAGFVSNRPTAAEKKKHEEIKGEENLNEEEWIPGEGIVTTRRHGGPGASIKEGGESLKDMVEAIYNFDKGIVHALENPETLLLNVALVGGGAFLVYYGAALMLGVRKPVAAPVMKAVAP